MAALALALGLAVTFVQGRRNKLVALGVACLIPVVLVLSVGGSQGCLGAPGGDECFGFSFGLIEAFVLLPGWTVLVILGTFARNYRGA